MNADCIYDTQVFDFICKCKSGYEGNGLRNKCHLDDSVGLFLVYAQGASLNKIPFESSNENQITNREKHDNRIVHIPGQTAVAISYDCHEQFIYWSDVSSNIISRIRYDGSNYSVVLENVKSAEGLAVDWLSRNIYFTDAEQRTIEVASLNGKYRKILVNTNLKNPRGIAVDPIDGYIFWCDWNRKSPKIERANMDGTQRKIIVSSDLGVPNSLYFDHKRQEVCWADAKTKRIECCAKDGSNRRLVTQMNQIYPFDITEVKTNIYWSDWSNKEIQNIDKDGVVGPSLKLSVGGNGRVYGIVAIKSQCQQGFYYFKIMRKSDLYILFILIKVLMHVIEITVTAINCVCHDRTKVVNVPVQTKRQMNAQEHFFKINFIYKINKINYYFKLRYIIV